MNKKKTVLLIICLLSSLMLSSATYTEAELRGLLLSNNLKLRSAIDEQELSLLDVKDAKAGYGPTIDLEISGTTSLPNGYNKFVSPHLLTTLLQGFL